MKLHRLRRTISALSCFATGILIASAPVGAQEAMSGAPLRIVVPFPAGTALDAAARELALRLSPGIGRPVTVDNRTGAGGNIGTESVVRSPADGLTVLLTAHNPITINPLIYEKLKLDPLNELAPIASLSRGGYLLATGPKASYRNVAELIAAAKKNPGGITYASYGYGSMAHICMEQFQIATGTQLRHVPYRGAIAPDLMSGIVDVAFENLAPSIGLVKDQRLTPLAVTLSRVAPLPQVPTVSETVSNFECYSWVGIFAPKDTPTAVQDKLSEEITRIARDPAYQSRLVDLFGAEPAPMERSQFREFVKADAAKWRKVIPPLNIKLD